MNEQVIPTRMELLKLKGRIKLAQKGHKLLKQKRDALIMEFFKIYGRASDLREELNEAVYEAYKKMASAELRHGPTFLEEAAMDMSEPIIVDVRERNVMGLRIPEVKKETKTENAPGKTYSVLATDIAIDEVVKAYQKALFLIVELAETENALKRLIKEIEKTKRRVNALEYILIPRLEDQKGKILLRLEEMERESFFTLKMLKQKR